MVSKKQWGQAIWFLFHTLAYKLNDDQHVNVLMKQIFNMCHNLPCSECSNHASAIIKTVNQQNIDTREKLIKLMLDFHNIINKRLGTDEFKMEQHNELYSTANTRKIIDNYIIIMRYNNYTERGMLHSFKRRQCLNDFIKYINGNLSKFSP
jgi:hypothetical protein